MGARGRWTTVALKAAGSVAAGFAASSAMTLSTAVQQRVLPPRQGPVDYDASRHVPQAVGAVLGREPQSRTEQHVYFALAHWGYGSAVALTYRPVRSAVGNDLRAGLVFYAGCEAMALSMLPTLGGTPAPSRWSRRLVATSFAQHAVYAAVVVAAHRWGPALTAAVGPRRSSRR